MEREDSEVGPRDPTQAGAPAEVGEAPASRLNGGDDHVTTPEPARIREAVLDADADADADAEHTRDSKPDPDTISEPSATSSLDTPGPLRPNQRVGEYEVQRLIGRGGMGWVYEGVHPVIGKRVAIKVLKAAYCTDPAAVQRFVSEAKAVNLIGHPNIIDIFAFGELADGSPYFVMDLHEGPDLRQEIKQRQPLPWADLRSLVEQLLDGLAAAHEAGIVHRDLKPDNLLMLRSSRAGPQLKILDFGVAKLTEDAIPQGATRTGAPIGTPAYMAPEQCLGREVDPRADLYAVGVILYELVTGAVPFSGDSYLEVLFAQVHYPPLPPSARVTLPAELETLVLWCLEKSPGARPPDIAALRNPLLRVLDDLTDTDAPLPTAVRTPLARRGTAQHTSTPTAAAGEVPGTVPETRFDGLGFHPPTPATEPPPAGRRRRPTLRWAAGATALAVTVAAGLALAGSDLFAPSASPSTSSSPQSSDLTAGDRESHPGYAAPTRRAGAPSPGSDPAEQRAEAKPHAEAPPRAEATPRSEGPTAMPDGKRRPLRPIPSHLRRRIEQASTPPPTVRLRLDSHPRGAEVRWQGQRWAKTPAVLALPRGNGHLEVTLRRPGYRPTRERIPLNRDAVIRTNLRRVLRRPPRRRSALDGFKLHQ